MLARSGSWRGWVIAVAGLVLAGCTGQRPLVDVRASGEKAYERGQYDRALADYVEYVGRRPGDDDVQNKLALTLLQVNDAPRAVEHAWRAHDLNPQKEEYVETLAESMYQAGQTSELHTFLRRQTESRGRVSDYLRLGRYSALTGDADSAETALKTAAELDRGRTLAPQLALADFYRRIGDKPSEIRRLRMALYLDPANSEITERLRELGEIPGPSFVLKPTEAP